MRRPVPLLVAAATLTALAVVPASSSAACPWVGSTASPTTKASQVLARMTLGEKVQLVSGASSSGPSAGVIKGVSRLCIPSLVLNDASAGIGNRQTGTTAYPDEIAQAATWDTSLQSSMGRALGMEAAAKGVNVVFGPGVNLARNPLNGRGFEYAGEDPVLAGKTAASLVSGIQSQHVIATVKHLALNDQETNRTTVSSDASERVAAELYLQPFEAAVKAGVGSAMCAYNRVSSTYACQDKSLLDGVLKGRLGFTGFVVSDFQATHSTAAANTGLDMEMPTARYFGAALTSAVQSGAVPVSRLNDMVKRVLTSMFRIGLVDHPPRAAVSNATTATSISVATRVAQQGAVLLRNSGMLPLASTVKKIAVIGDAASQDGAPRAAQGYGSAHVPQFGYSDHVSSPLAAITSRASRQGATVSYEDGSGTAKAVLAAATADVAIVFVNDVNNEGLDRPDLKPHSGGCSVSGGADCTYSSVDQDQLVSAVAAANRNTVVVMQSGGPVEMPWVNQVAGIVEDWLPGQVDGAALAPLLFGDVNFSGKLPVTFPKAESDGPLKTAAQYPGVKDSKGVPHATYSEGLLMGYRWYDAKAIAPLYPFGYGLSYTTFQYSRLRMVPGRTGVTVQVTLKNAGSRAGAEVVQVYVSAPTSAGEPPKALGGFVKLTLKPGESRTVSVPVDNRALSVWSTARHAWTPVKGCYVVRAGGGSRSLPLIGKLSRGGSVC
ncbi:MAG: glycosyl hydrolase [Frankiales bacterium]|nr:glycosyl hydrolase [Frankiales bacterium]